ncbi:hypothetical protein ScalyP_jg644 [Parmales sp. scaly parma]|nr:hypothetical protein ScalyP_jg644 [Parmales sp. scaly parma]
MGDTKQNDSDSDNDDQILSISSNPNPSPSKTTSPSYNKNLSLNTSLANDIAEEKEDTLEADLERHAKSEVLIIFELPDGSQCEEKFMLGHTVEVLKAFLSSEVDLDFATSKLFIDNSKLLLDPMQLSDYIKDNSADVYIRVEGDMEETSHK